MSLIKWIYFSFFWLPVRVGRLSLRRELVMQQGLGVGSRTRYASHCWVPLPPKLSSGHDCRLVPRPTLSQVIFFRPFIQSLNIWIWLQCAGNKLWINNEVSCHSTVSTSPLACVGQFMSDFPRRVLPAVAYWRDTSVLGRPCFVINNLSFQTSIPD